MHEKEFTINYFTVSVGPLELPVHNAQWAFCKSVDRVAHPDLTRQFSCTHEKATEIDQQRTKIAGFFLKINLNHHQHSNTRSFKILIIYVQSA